ncbi:MAG: FAD-dependent oxidoreductase [Halobacteriovoraceae bacterium]|nr:FAD-dependent oxidoreductase [Halobacteriovoraceae bacterium]MBT5094140.1 FAD-dependent oxidoreductase [Halobacteriovoraceae bacterium]
MSLKTVDVLVVGGGIVGIGIFRDLSMHNISTLLIEKKDFSSQTSQSSSKMLHGGIRYLENLDFALVWEALHEKNLWLSLAPHLCQEKAFYLPIYKESKRPLWMIRSGLALYDFLSGYQNSPHKIKNKNQVIEALPKIQQAGLKGAGVYYDAIIDDAQLGLEVLFDALRNPVVEALNYTALVDVKKDGSNLICTLRDEMNAKEWQVIAKDIVFALGPFTDQVLGKIDLFDWKDCLLPSKGSHLWFDKNKLPIDCPMVLNTKDDRVIFVIPHDNKVLVGTTEVLPEEDYFDMKPKQSEIDYLLSCLKQYFPNVLLAEKDILSSFAGVRPLVKEDSSSNLGKTTRDHKVFRPLSNIYSIVGGKYTTFRVMGQEITRNLVLKKGFSYNSNLTKRPLRQKKYALQGKNDEIGTEVINGILENEKVKTFHDLVVRRLGVPGKSHWKQSVCFDDFFINLLPLLKEHFEIDEEDIRNFS